MGSIRLTHHHMGVEMIPNDYLNSLGEHGIG